MFKQKQMVIILSFFCIVLSLGSSVCLAAVKTPTDEKTTKAPEKIKNIEAKPVISQKIIEKYSELIKSQPLLIVIKKAEYKLYLFKDEKEIKNYDIAVGQNPGQKQSIGDKTTPTGLFEVDEIIDSRYWTHDFNDGNGEIEGAYGPWFISLETEWNGIGIHGTHDPSSIRTMASEGCIRMNNDKVAELKELISIGVKVIIE